MSAVRVLALSGGVGGAKLALGLQRMLAPGDLTVVANTGDDFEHLGLSISPDVDTILYTLSGRANAETGWGRSEETWHFMTELEQLGGETWFRLGDRDIALHVERTRRLHAGERPASIVRDFAARLGVRSRVIPMSDDPVRTMLETDAGWLAFQEYFVRRKCVPGVTAIHYEGAHYARPPNDVIQALATDHFSAVVICPSNPFLSIDPILAIPGWRAALRETRTPVIAVSPIIAAAAVKGPTAKLMRELGQDVSALAVARHYGDLLEAFIIDVADNELRGRFEIPSHVAPTLMLSLQDRDALATEVLKLAETFSETKRLRRASQ